MDSLALNCRMPLDQGRFTLWVRWALAQGPAPKEAPHLLDVPLGKVEKEKQVPQGNNDASRWMICLFYLLIA